MKKHDGVAISWYATLVGQHLDRNSMGEVIEVNFGRKRAKAVSYARDIESGRNQQYEVKFAGFLQLCEDARTRQFDAVIVAFPEVLGDTYDELIANLCRASDAGLTIVIAETR